MSACGALCIKASAGKGVSANRSLRVRVSLALRPRWRAACTRSAAASGWLGDRPSWCARVAGSAATWWKRATAHRAASGASGANWAAGWIAGWIAGWVEGAMVNVSIPEWGVCSYKRKVGSAQCTRA